MFSIPRTDYRILCKNKIWENAQVSDDFMIIARESLVLDKGMDDVIERKAYLAAGADGIMVNSFQEDGQEILEFCKESKLEQADHWLLLLPSIAKRKQN